MPLANINKHTTNHHQWEKQVITTKQLGLTLPSTIVNHGRRWVGIIHCSIILDLSTIQIIIQWYYPALFYDLASLWLDGLDGIANILTHNYNQTYGGFWKQEYPKIIHY